LIGRAEIERSFIGAWRLFLSKPDALKSFDTSIEGFWRSFQVIVLVAPLYFVTAVADRLAGLDDAVPAGAGAFWATQVLALVLDWVTLPLLLAAVAGLIGVKRQYPAYITVRNWATPLMLAPFAAASALQIAGLNEDMVIVLSLAALGLSLRFGYLIARRTLNVGIDVAVGFVALDVLVSFAVVMAIGRLTGIGPLD